MTDQQGNNPGEDRPGPHQGVFGAPGSPSPGSPGSQPPGSRSPGPPGSHPPGSPPYGSPGSHPPGSPPYGDPRSPYGDYPGPYGDAFGGDPNPYGYQPGPPKQVTVAAVMSIGLGAICLLLAALALSSAGEQIAEIVLGSKDARGQVVAVILICAVAYILPAIFLLKRRAWARYLLIAVAAIGIAGGLMELPRSILTLAIHGTLLYLMLQQPTKLWFHHR
ncbi:hypothetical protein [Kribbella swartbergensis]